MKTSSTKISLVRLACGVLLGLGYFFLATLAIAVAPDLEFDVSLLLINLGLSFLLAVSAFMRWYVVMTLTLCIGAGTQLIMLAGSPRP